MTCSQHGARVSATDEPPRLKQRLRDLEPLRSILVIVTIGKLVVDSGYLSNYFLLIGCVVNLENLLLEVSHHFTYLIISPGLGHLGQVALLSPLNTEILI